MRLAGVDTALASAIGEDVLARAVSFAAPDIPGREVLMTPFSEETPAALSSR